MPDRAGSTKVRHRSMADEVAELLRQMILRRELEPGQRITQEELAQTLGVSTMPVREALLRLVAEGLVATSPNRAFNVVRTTPEDIRDVFWVHSMLAAELTRRACQRVDDALLAELREHHAAYERAVGAGDRPRMEDANWAFHKAIHERAAAPKLALVLRNTLRFFPDFSLEVPGWEELASRWQSQVMKAMSRGECDKAADAASKNVRQAAELFVTYFEPGG